MGVAAVAAVALVSVFVVAEDESVLDVSVPVASFVASVTFCSSSERRFCIAELLEELVAPANAPPDSGSVEVVVAAEPCELANVAAKD